MHLSSMWPSFVDELTKIAEVSTLGLTPGTLLGVPQPQPMETVGFQKARSILELAEQMKTAEASPMGLTNPGLAQVTRKRKEDPGVVQQAKGLGAYTAGGAGIGRMVGEFSAGRHALGPAQTNNRWWGTAIGAGVGAAEYGRRKLMQHQAARAQQKTAGAFSPALALKWGQQTGKVRPGALRSKGSISSIVRGSQIH